MADGQDFSVIIIIAGFLLISYEEKEVVDRVNH
jgi:hypothetical protein